MKKSEQACYLFLIFATLLDILLLCYITFYPVSQTFRFNVIIFDLILCLVFWVEFIYRYLHSEDKKQYVEDNLLSMLGMLPVDFAFLRALRLIKLFHLIKIYILSKDDEDSVENFLKRTYLDKILVIAVIFIIALTVLITVVDTNIPDIHTAIGILIFSTITAVISSIYVTRINKDNHDDLDSKLKDLTCEMEKLNKKIDELKKE